MQVLHVPPRTRPDGHSRFFPRTSDPNQHAFTVGAGRSPHLMDPIHSDAGPSALSHDYVDWYALAGPEGHGAAVTMGHGLARALRARAGVLSMAADTSVVPPGRVLKARAWLGPLGGLGLPTAVSPLLLANVAVAQAGETVRFRALVLPLGHADPGAVDRCSRFTKGWVEVGGNQDELVGECRWAVRTLRQRLSLMMAAEPRMADIAREIRRRSQVVLRNPASHEAARH